jgi:5-methylcytosine-specific restriction endonuclease McrA
MLHQCVICGKVFERNRVDARYCSAVCHSLRKRNGKRPDRECNACGEIFAPVAKGHLYCSAQCAKPAKSRVRWKPCPTAKHYFTVQSAPSCGCVSRPARAPMVKRCIECGVDYHREPLDGRSLRCAPCRALHAAEQKRIGKDRRRARRRDAYRADVWRSKIYLRDNYRCQICGKKLKMNLMVPHPLSPVLDHIVPLARGGTHEPANVQAAHFLCNSRKAQYGGGEQLLLIG